jgi:uncharacterized tellurite resistance protein B-like protein
MISSIQDWFKTQFEEQNTTPEHSIELATAVLLYEVMRADNKFEKQEHDIYLEQLKQHFTLSDAELEALTKLTEKKSENAADYHQFTSVINDMYEAEQKRALLDSLWAVAYADHELSPHEDYTIRKIAELLYIPHSQFIQSKLSIQPD